MVDRGGSYPLDNQGGTNWRGDFRLALTFGHSFAHVNFVEYLSRNRHSRIPASEPLGANDFRRSWEFSVFFFLFRPRSRLPLTLAFLSFSSSRLFFLLPTDIRV